MAESSVPCWFGPTLNAILDGQDLAGDAMTTMMEGLLAGEASPVETAALLVALRSRGESAGELASAAAVMRRHCQPLDLPGEELLDTCGTGGDGLATFNISTATALVVAGAGVKVVKHGNRAVSSTSGSADVLAVLGVHTAADGATARRCLAAAGMAFCLAPVYHPALRHVGEVRRRLGIRTLFNCLGPLANPARARFQLLGVGRREWLDRMAHALAVLGTERAFLVHSTDGLDEVSLSAPTLVREVQGHTVLAREWTPADFGLPPCLLTDLRVDGPEASAAVIRRLLDGEAGPCRNVVLANAAAALLAAGRATSPRQGVALAADAIDSGRARRVLQSLVELTTKDSSDGHQGTSHR
ncbi:MAG: anthranilate phosphoribosyltransferase [Gemmataceae bacterium]